MAIEHPDQCSLCGARLDSKGRCPSCTPTAWQPTARMEEEVSVIGGRYELKHRLGKGGMGEVWQAYDRRLETEVALKMVRQRVADDSDTQERFHLEVRTARQIRHPNVAAVYDLFEDDGRAFFTMELVPGRSLSEVLEERLDVEQALSLARDLARGLAAIHEVGIVHRDIKPANVRVTPEGKAVLLDLGVAKDTSQPGLTQAGWVVGTPDYMAPEQAQGRAVTPAADIYSLGLIFYRMFTGQRVESGAIEGEGGWTQRTLQAPSKVNPEIPPWLDQVLAVCLEPRAQKRYQNAQKLLADLEAERRPITQQTVTVSRRTLLGVTGGTVLVLTAVLVVALLWWLNRNPEQPLASTPLTFDVGLEGGGGLSPDGSQLIYAGYDGVESDLYRRALVEGAGREELTRTPNESEMEAVYSHAGTRIAFSAVGPRGGVAVMPASGGAVRFLLRDAHRPRWAPDDDRILAQRGHSEPPAPDVLVVSATAEEGEPLSLRSLYDLAPRTPLHSADWWSQEEIVAVQGARTVMLFNLDPAAPTKKPFFEVEQGAIRDLCVDRERGEVAFLVEGPDGLEPHLWRTRGERVVGSGGYLELTSCRSQQILLTRARRQMQILEAQLSRENGRFRVHDVQPLEVLAVGDEQREFMPTLSPDGRWLAFISSRSETLQVWIKELPDGEPRQVSTLQGEHRWPAFRPDSRYLAYSSKAVGKGDILIYDLETGEEVNLTNPQGDPGGFYEGAPDWFPDGERLVINTKEGGGYNLAEVSFPEGRVTLLTRDPEVDIDPAVSPDGERVVFHRDGVLYTLELADAEDARLRAGEAQTWVPPLQRLVPGSTPRWSAEGDAVIYQADGDLWLLPFPYNGEDPLRLTHHPWPRRRLEGVWKFSIQKGAEAGASRLVFSVVEHRSGEIVRLAPAGQP